MMGSLVCHRHRIQGKFSQTSLIVAHLPLWSARYHEIHPMQKTLPKSTSQNPRISATLITLFILCRNQLTSAYLCYDGIGTIRGCTYGQHLSESQHN